MQDKQPKIASTTAELRRLKRDRTEFSQRPRLPIMVVLDRVRQGYNIDAIFRLCDAMLAERLVICGVEIHPRKKRLAQAALGTQYRTPWAQENSAEEAVARARANGYQIVVVELAPGSVLAEHFNPTFPVCLVLGGEREGVSPKVMNLADAVIEIPMRGMANSINVSTAAAIALYALSSRAEALGYRCAQS